MVVTKSSALVYFVQHFDRIAQKTSTLILINSKLFLQTNVLVFKI
jgi:hypothetical protein